MAQVVNGVEFPDDASREEIDAFFAQEQASEPTAAQKVGQFGMRMLPAAGAIAGGTLGTMAGGPPGTIGGSAAGAAGGEALRQYLALQLGLEPLNPLGVGGQGALGGALAAIPAGGGMVAQALRRSPPLAKGAAELAGRQIPGVGRAIDAVKLGKTVMQALRPAEKVAEKAAPVLRPTVAEAEAVGPKVIQTATKAGRGAAQRGVSKAALAQRARDIAAAKAKREGSKRLLSAARPATAPQQIKAQLEKSLALESEMNKLGLSAAEKAMYRSRFAQQ